jgi:hypothetical protein
MHGQGYSTSFFPSGKLFSEGKPDGLNWPGRRRGKSIFSWSDEHSHMQASRQDSSHSKGQQQKYKRPRERKRHVAEEEQAADVERGRMA